MLVFIVCFVLSIFALGSAEAGGQQIEKKENGKGVVNGLRVLALIFMTLSFCVARFL